MENPELQQLWKKINAVDGDSPDLFYEWHWQKGKGVDMIYLRYRVIFLAALAFATVWSIWKPDDQEYYKNDAVWLVTIWLVYISNWATLACCISSALGAAVIGQRYLEVRMNPGCTECENTNCKLRCIYKGYYVAHKIAVTFVLFTTFLYWAMVYSPPTFPATVIGVIVHGVFAVVMVVDLFLVAFPFRMYDFFWPFLTLVIYGIFTYVHHFLGGLDRKNRRFIYDALNWQKPGRAIFTALLAIVTLFACHSVAWLLTRLKYRLRPSRCTIQHHVPDVGPSVSQDDCCDWVSPTGEASCNESGPSTCTSHEDWAPPPPKVCCEKPKPPPKVCCEKPKPPPKVCCEKPKPPPKICFDKPIPVVCFTEASPQVCCDEPPPQVCCNNPPQMETSPSQDSYELPDHVCCKLQ